MIQNLLPYIKKDMPLMIIYSKLSAILSLKSHHVWLLVVQVLLFLLIVFKRGLRLYLIWNKWEVLCLLESFTGNRCRWDFFRPCVGLFMKYWGSGADGLFCLQMGLIEALPRYCRNCESTKSQKFHSTPIAGFFFLSISFFSLKIRRNEFNTCIDECTIFFKVTYNLRFLRCFLS